MSDLLDPPATARLLRDASPISIERRATLADPAAGLGALTMAVAPLGSAAGPVPLRTALIDGHRFSRDCVLLALSRHEHPLDIETFATVEECAAVADDRFDLVICSVHGGAVRSVTLLHERFPATPIILMSDAEDAGQSSVIRSILRSGAQGFIPTRTSGIAIASAAIRVVTAGGTFAPLDLLLSKDGDGHAGEPSASRRWNLTERQTAVLALMQRGKANKIIAHELRMSESTVKVHVRNIMRKMGATNRTQAAYNAQRLGHDGDGLHAG